jgi:hypothetical protein
MNSVLLRTRYLFMSITILSVETKLMWKTLGQGVVWCQVGIPPALKMVVSVQAGAGGEGAGLEHLAASFAGPQPDRPGELGVLIAFRPLNLNGLSESAMAPGGVQINWEYHAVLHKPSSSQPASIGAEVNTAASGTPWPGRSGVAY